MNYGKYAKSASKKRALTVALIATFALVMLVGGFIPQVHASTRLPSPAVPLPPLGTPLAPTVNATAIDVNQPLNVNDTIPLTGTGPYAWQWWISTNGGAAVLATQCAVNSGTGASAGDSEICTIAGYSLTVGDTYNFEFQVTDASPVTTISSQSSSVVVNSVLLAPAAPTVSANKIDQDQVETLTATIPSTGTSPYAYAWGMVYDAGHGFGSPTPMTGICLVSRGGPVLAGTIVTCTIPSNTLSPGAYEFFLGVADNSGSATNARSHAEVTSALSVPVGVSIQLLAPSTPSVGSARLDQDQVETVVATIPPSGFPTYSWTWMVSINGAADVAATQCTVNSGSFAPTNPPTTTLETCTIAGGALIAGDTYSFELQVTDSATTPETATSAASATVMVNTQLGVPSTPTLSAAKLDVTEAETVTGAVPSSGTSTYSYQWLVSTTGPSGTFTAATQCAVNSITGVSAGAVYCYIASTALGTYNFELQVTDTAGTPETTTSLASATLTVSSPLGVPSTPIVSSSTLDVNQQEQVSAMIPTSGSATYSWAWLIDVNNGGWSPATQCADIGALNYNSGSGAGAGATVYCTILGNTLSVGSTYNFKLNVTDSASPPETTVSLPLSSGVVVNTALITPSTPSSSRPLLDQDQVETVTSIITASGTAPYSWQWWVSINGGGYTPATQCVVSSGTGASAGTLTCMILGSTLSPVDIYNFKLQITDSATVPFTLTSSASSTVTVSTVLTAPSAPSPSLTVLAVNPAAESQALTVTGTIPSTGTSPTTAFTYSWKWWVSINGGSYVAATQCATNSGSGASAGNTETCWISAPAAGIYNFKLQVNDSATTPEIATSAASATVYAHVQSVELVTLLTLYNGRPDLQTAFPEVYTTGTFTNLVNWAAKVVTNAPGYGVDGARSTLLPYSYWYVLMSVYNQRSDLQTAFPVAYYYQSSYQGLVTWSGLVVTGAPGYGTDSARTALQPSPYWYALMGIYFSRPDLQTAFPNALTMSSSFQNLVTWAGKVVSGAPGYGPDGAHAALGTYGYWYDLMGIYFTRPDLMAAFPNAYTSSYSWQQLVDWADAVVTNVPGYGQDSAHTALNAYGSWYVANGTPL